MGLLIVNEDKCKQDNLCVADCPVQIMFMPEGGYPQIIPGAEQFCIACGHCVAVCPTGAISHPQVLADDCLPITKEARISPEQAVQFLRSRRSIRQFKAEPASREELERLMDMARYAQTGHNSQSAQWKIYTNPHDVHALAGLVVDWMRKLVDKKDPLAEMMNMAMIVKSFDGGKDFVMRDAPHLAVCHAHAEDRFADRSADIALTYLELYAPILGLGTCWAGYFQAAALFFKPLQQFLDLPAGHLVKGGLMLGRPKVKYFRCPERKPLRAQWV